MHLWQHTNYFFLHRNGHKLKPKAHINASEHNNNNKLLDINVKKLQIVDLQAKVLLLLFYARARH